MFAMNWGMDYWVSYSFNCPASPQTKSKSIKKHRLRTTVSMSGEQMAITKLTIRWVHCNQTKIFELFLLGRIRWYPGFNRWPLPLLRTRWVKKWTDFFKIRNYLATHAMYFTEKSVLRYYVRFSHIRSQILSVCYIWEHEIVPFKVSSFKD